MLLYMSDFINKLRYPKIKINDNLEIAVFDITTSYIGVYIISKYILELKKPGITSAIALIPISYLSHEYFSVETPLNNFINGKKTDDNKLELPSAPIYNNLQSQPDLNNNNLQMTSYEKMERKPSVINDALSSIFGN